MVGDEAEPSGHRRRARKGWLVLVVLAGCLGAANALGTTMLLLGARWIDALFGLLSMVGMYWFAMGAWRRTPWGSHPFDAAPLPQPVLSEGRALGYIVAAAACVGAAGIAVALQAFVLSR